VAIGAASAVDPYVLNSVFPGVGAVDRYNEYPSRTQVAPALVGGETTRCILTLGDSHSANCAPSTYTATQARNHNLNVSNGGVYLLAGPLLGPSNGKVAPLIAGWNERLGDAMIVAGRCARSIMCGIGYGSTKVSDWAVGGAFNRDIGVACERFRRNGFTVDAVIWHAGPNDDAAGTTQASYATSLTSVINTIRGFLATTPILVTLCSNSVTPNVGIRAAQAGVWNSSAKIFAGIDEDGYSAINFQAPLPNHPSDTGCNNFATDYVTALIAAGAI